MVSGRGKRKRVPQRCTPRLWGHRRCSPRLDGAGPTMHPTEDRGCRLPVATPAQKDPHGPCHLPSGAARQQQQHVPKRGCFGCAMLLLRRCVPCIYFVAACVRLWCTSCGEELDGQPKHRRYFCQCARPIKVVCGMIVYVYFRTM